MRTIALVPVYLWLFLGCAIEEHRSSRDSVVGTLKQPHLAALGDGRLAVTWAVVGAEGRADIALSIYAPQEDRWGPVRYLNSSPGSAVAGRQVGPRLAVADGVIAVSWVDRMRDPAGDILVSVSEDEGLSFSVPTRVNDDYGTETAQEYHDIASNGEGGFIVVWLDERDAPEADRNRKQVYVSFSCDGGLSFSKNRALTASAHGVCPCCRPSIARGGGATHVVYRDRTGKSLFIRSRSLYDGAREFSAPVTLSGGWDFPGCPVNGPAVAAGPSDRVWALWVEDGELRWARSDDKGRTFVTAGVVDGGRDRAASNLALVSSGERALATWENGLGQICVVALPTEGGPSYLRADCCSSRRVDDRTFSRDRDGERGDQHLLGRGIRCRRQYLSLCLTSHGATLLVERRAAGLLAM